MKNFDQVEKLKVTVLAEDSVMYESPYLGQHGLALLVQAWRGAETYTFLVDVAQHPDALITNMELMHVDASSIDAIVLTHCHYDHTRGLAHILEHIGKTNVPVVAHRDIFRLHFVTSPYLQHIGVRYEDAKERIEAAGGVLFLTHEPLQLFPGVSTTGEVKRQTDFEDAGLDLKMLEQGKIQEDRLKDDIAVIANVKDKGLVILTGCSHAGIINIARFALEITQHESIEGIVGGLHLIEASEEKIKRTVIELSKQGVKWIAAGHCTGFNAQRGLSIKFGDRFTPLQTGMVIEI
ncbi:metallo-beta-lactamase domain protein, putative [Candidatus Vecturithrix granuli]|uniref:Metallo-beta-lactamase domain protein, putative n=1 Tax=Vecturithrix granuli TaxID=1499967 RepID=A0A0S6W901_VECG1|nr:metallo-beta-lactamase domain protein, putative [Candidatus Vecturithrix granuli]